VNDPANLVEQLREMATAFEEEAKLDATLPPSLMWHAWECAQRLREAADVIEHAFLRPV
jgi:hypothetical protein